MRGVDSRAREGRAQVGTDFVLPAAARNLHAYWNDARGNADMPGVEHLSGTRLRPWVGDISIVRLCEGPKRFFVALHGENVSRYIGPGFHRKFLEDVVPKAAQALAFAPYRYCLDHRTPVYSIMRPDADNGLMADLERFVLPFRDADGREIGRLLIWVAPSRHQPDAIGTVYGPDVEYSGRGESAEMYEVAADGIRRVAEPDRARGGRASVSALAGHGRAAPERGARTSRPAGALSGLLKIFRSD